MLLKSALFFSGLLGRDHHWDLIMSIGSTDHHPKRHTTLREKEQPVVQQNNGIMSNNKQTKVQISLYASKLKNVAGAFKGRSMEETVLAHLLSDNSWMISAYPTCLIVYTISLFCFFFRYIRSLCDRDCVSGGHHRGT